MFSNRDKSKEGFYFTDTIGSFFISGRQLMGNYISRYLSSEQSSVETATPDAQQLKANEIVSDYLSADKIAKRDDALHIVLDLHGTLVVRIPDQYDEPYNRKWFEENRLVAGSHIMVPAAPEFLLFLLKSNFKISFFNDSEDHAENTELVEALIIRALGSKENYLKIKPHISIHSGLTEVEVQEELKLKEQYDWQYPHVINPSKKDLSVINGNMKKMVVVENDLSVSRYPEYTLKVPGANVRSFGFSGADVYQQNQLFYVAGLLKEIHESGNPHKFLFQLQYRPGRSNDAGEFSYRSTMSLLHQRIRFYESGLTVFKDINPEISFYSKLVEEHKYRQQEKLERTLNMPPAYFYY